MFNQTCVLHFCSRRNNCLKRLLTVIFILLLILVYFAVVYAVLKEYPDLCPIGLGCPFPAVFPMGIFLLLVVILILAVLFVIFLFVKVCIWEPCTDEIRRAQSEII